MSRVCVFGDSIAWGSWDPAGGGWVGRLREAGCNRADSSNLEYGDYTAVYNCGISGDKVGDVLARFDVEAAAREPAAIVLAIGINDVPHQDYPGTPPGDFAGRYEDLIGKAKNYTDYLVAVTPTNVDEAVGDHGYGNVDIAALVEIVERCAASHSFPSINVFGLMTSDDLKTDGLHPGPAGHQKLFEAIAPTVFELPSLNG